MRTIKSFVLRTGRISRRQQFALDNWLGDYLLPCDGIIWDMVPIFNRNNDTIVEIGFGMGASLLTMAMARPDINFVGIEVHQAGIGSLVADLHDKSITNVRLVLADAVTIFDNQLANNSLSGIQIFFPDPWHKKKHHKRRLIQPKLVESLVDKLKIGGFIHCATDWQDYALHMLAVLSADKSLVNAQLDGGFTPRPLTRPLTKFEQRGRHLGHGVWDLLYTKC
jgi:tRNA (guanine-N7-)-methyltransferase